MYLFDHEKVDFYGNLEKCGFASLIECDSLIKKTMQYKLDRQGLNNENYVTININKDQVNKIKNSDFLDIFVRLDFTIIENEQDEFNITLDNKFASVPYLLVTTRN